MMNFCNNLTKNHIQKLIFPLNQEHNTKEKMWKIVHNLKEEMFYVKENYIVERKFKIIANS